MRKIRCYITRRFNKLYLVTAFKPHKCEVRGTGHHDAYVTYGDPIGYINITQDFVCSIWPNCNIKVGETKRGIMISDDNQEPTHIVTFNKYVNVYTIKTINGSEINYVCNWFVSHMFNINTPTYDKYVHYTGYLLEKKK